MTRLTDHIVVMEHITPAKLGKPKPQRQPKKAHNPKIDKEAILERRYGFAYHAARCECKCNNFGDDLHHAFIGRMKGYPILDDERNLVLVNHYEHVGRKFDNPAWREHFWEIQVKRYGEKKMREWVDAVLAAGLDKSRLDWLNG